MGRPAPGCCSNQEPPPTSTMRGSRGTATPQDVPAHPSALPMLGYTTAAGPGGSFTTWKHTNIPKGKHRGTATHTAPRLPYWELSSPRSLTSRQKRDSSQVSGKELSSKQGRETRASREEDAGSATSRGHGVFAGRPASRLQQVAWRCRGRAPCWQLSLARSHISTPCCL